MMSPHWFRQLFGIETEQATAGTYGDQVQYITLYGVIRSQEINVFM